MKIIMFLVSILLIPIVTRCQTLEKAANQAFIITRMVNKFHVEPREINASFSADVLKSMLDKTDSKRIFFTKADINRLSAYRSDLSEQIKHQKTDFLSLFITIYSVRLHEADSLITIINNQPIDFYLNDKFTVAEDTLYPVSVDAMKVKLYKKLKTDMLYSLTDNLPGNISSFADKKKKIYIDSALSVLQKKITATLKREINGVLHYPDGINQYIGNIYCKCIALCFDPHTEFFPPQDKESFESALGKHPFLFGFNIKPDKNGGVLIDNLQPGSPAYRCGKLNKGDKFISIQWNDKPPVDVSEVTVDEFSLLLEETSHKPVLFTVKKSDGTIVQPLLQKEQASEDADDKVKSFILRGEHATIGYIYLPAFYEDWTSRNEGLNGCANDVGREILKLKKENITGLMIDVRYNGGGSVNEAKELVGIFIDAGPVAQVKGKEAKINVLKDNDRGTIYDGPMVVLVNGYSASASELFAGSLQDYNRAIIIGSSTYGKATMQVVLPIDTTVTEENYTQKHTENYLKLTIGKLYRVNGTSAQFTGVQPDILLPDMLNAYISKEADEPFALKPGTVAPNKYYAPYPPIKITALAQQVQLNVDTNKYFKAVNRLVSYSQERKGVKDLSLNVNLALSEMEATNKLTDEIPATASFIKRYSVHNTPSETERLQASKTLNELNEQFIKQVAGDATINIAFDVLLKLKP